MVKSHLIIAILVLAGCSEKQASNPIIERAKQKISDLLKDPSSAQFRKISTIGTCVQGEINGKNEYGGYSGFKEFFFDDKLARAEIRPDKGTFYNKTELEDSDYLAAGSTCVKNGFEYAQKHLDENTLN